MVHCKFTDVLVNYFRGQATIDELEAACLNDDQRALVQNIKDEKKQ